MGVKNLEESSSESKRPLNRMGSTSQSLSCDICSKTFKTKGCLETHRKHVHDKIRNFECGICNKLFLARQSEQRHRKLVHDRIKDLEKIRRLANSAT